jgi:hypothetical protein
MDSVMVEVKDILWYGRGVVNVLPEVGVLARFKLA